MAQTKLVQIGSYRNKQLSARKALASGPVVDKFFAVGAICSIVGMGWLGSHMWLALHGQMQNSISYMSMKNAHIFLQFYVFFGCFILGFINQAGPKLLGISFEPSTEVYLQLILLVLGSTLLCIYPESSIGSLTIAAAFVVALYRVLQLSIGGRKKVNPQAAFLLTFGLVGYIVSTNLNLARAEVALSVFWITVFPILLASSEQFIAGFLGGAKLRNGNAVILCTLYTLSATISIFCAYHPTMTLAWQLLGVSGLATAVWYLHKTNTLKNLAKSISQPLGLAITLGYSWLLLTLLLLSFGSFYSPDLALHSLSTGWATTILIAASMQITGHLNGAPLCSNKTVLALLVAWQVVPFGRTLMGFAPLQHYRAQFSWLVLIVLTLVLLIWTYKLVSAEWTILRRQFSLRSGEHLNRC